MGKHGGQRPGAGRKVGTPTVKVKRTKDTKGIVAAAIAKGDITPLQVMLEALQQAYDLDGARGAFAYAKEIAPYVHPKRMPVDDKGSSNITIERLIFAAAAE